MGDKQKMSLEKIGNFVCVTENNTASGISGNGVTEPIGLDSNVYPEYNETCLFSSVYSCQTGNLSDSFAKYQRLRLRVGWHNNSTTTNESDSYLEVTPSPESGSNVAAIWSVSTGSPGYICVGRINFPTLSSFNGTYGKLCDMNGNTGNTGWEGKLRPIKEIWGVNKLSPYRLFGVPSEGGTVTAVPNSGYLGDISTIKAIPESNAWRQSAINITGAELTGNNFMFSYSDVSAQAEFEHSKDLTLTPNEHGTLSADKMTGFSGDVVTITATTDEGWYFTGMNVTGATATGNKFMFVGENVTAEGLYTDEGFPIVYENDGHGTCTGDKTIAVPGETVTLSTTYNTYYRLSGYQVTGGTVNGNTLTPTAACTARAVFKPNAFTATGNFEKGSNVSVSQNASYATTANVPAKYALHGAHTGDIPAAWYSTSNRWKVTSTVSGYKITLNPIMKFQINNDNASVNAYATACSLIGSTQTQTASWSYGKNSKTTATYSKSFTSNSTGVNYGISAKIQANGYMSTQNYYGRCTYLAAQTTGTWTATGYAP